MTITRQWRTWLSVVGLLLLAGVVTLGAAWVGNRGATTANARPRAEGPFMGVADPAAPYDQRFIDEMIMHHQGAITSAQMMIGQSSRPELRDLAQRIVAGQQRQIDRMRAMRAQWYGSADPPMMGANPMAGMMGGGNGGSMAGMMGGGMMSGMMPETDLDRMFLRMMIPHHQLAIDMAQDALVNAEHQELKDLAQEIITDQSAEITEMEGYLRDWYGDASTRDTAGSMRDLMQRMMAR